jgi:phosphatidylserine/phosphatidylglycerophosphate/cardiolipin synthase-like enzyme
MPLNPQEIQHALKRTLEDHRLSRGEQKLVRSIVEQIGDDPHTLALMRSQAFDLAAAEINSPHAKEVLGWIEEVVKALAAPIDTPQERPSRVCFSPNDDCPAAINGLIRMALKSIDICVFTITDNRISDELALAHDRGIAIRILTDNDKQFDAGSDIGRLTRLGIAVREDRSEYHMHHKFAIFDRRQLLNGSYNWTRSAAEKNEENLVVSQESSLVGEFQSAFDRLWNKFA